MYNKKFYNVFIIPSIGRKSLPKAIESALNTDEDAGVVVVFDGIKKFPPEIFAPPNDRVIYLKKAKAGWASGARNFGLDYIKQSIDTTFISFLDDDDRVLSKFGRVIKKTFHYKYDMILHSCRIGKNKIVPKNPKGKGITRGDVTIAMSIKLDKLKETGGKFVAQPAEDFIFIKSLIKAGWSYCKTGIVTYEAPVIGGTRKLLPAIKKKKILKR